MVNYDKSQPPPPELEIQKTKNNGDYGFEDVIIQLDKDFLGKCYLCESSKPTSLNVEHFIPHENKNKDLKFDWNNLFYACGHCNTIKRNNYSGTILNCTNPNHRVSEWIRYAPPKEIGEDIVIEAVQDDSLVHETVKLLKEIYSNKNKRLKQKESENLSEHLEKELIIFKKLLADYYYEKHPKTKEEYASIIRHEVRKNSDFTAFKRWMVSVVPILKRDFENEFD